MIHDPEHLFRYLFATHTSSLDIIGGLLICLLQLQKRLSLITLLDKEYRNLKELIVSHY